MRDLLTVRYPDLASKAAFVELLAEGRPLHTDPTTRGNLDSWVTTYKIPYTTLRDPDGVGLRIVSDFSPREWTFLVELSTMKILYKGNGYTKVEGAFTKLAGL